MVVGWSFTEVVAWPLTSLAGVALELGDPFQEPRPSSSRSPDLPTRGGGTCERDPSRKVAWSVNRDVRSASLMRTVDRAAHSDDRGALRRGSFAAASALSLTACRVRSSVPLRWWSLSSRSSSSE
jgi:hypothetical protein